VIDTTTKEGVRNRAIIEVLFSCGLRVSELVNLNISNLYVEERYVRVLGKGSKERLVPISDKAIDELEKWFEVRKYEIKVKPGEEDYVFLNRRGSHLTRTMILIMIK
jgi:integrase/recombinase XerD